jgi:nucleotide-binding universal stress UspA family protein
MKILVAHDGSKHGEWAMEWLGQLPPASEPAVTILHVVDVTSLQAPFMAQPVVWANEGIIQKELKRLDVRAKNRVNELRESGMRSE